jgi:DnaJ-class molecular chaperone
MSGHGNQDADYLNGRHKEVPCSDCNGSGLEDTSGFGDMATCETCKGRGVIAGVGVPEGGQNNG